MSRVLVAYSPHRMGRDKAGRECLETHILSTVAEVEAALREKGYRTDRAPLHRDVRRFVTHLKRFRPAVVFNLCEQVGGDAALEMHAAAVLALCRLPFTGNPPLALALCQEKASAKRLLRQARIPTPEFEVYRPGTLPEEPIPFPAIVKPARADGSLGITARSVVRSLAALRRRVEYVHRRFGQAALAERFVSGREFQVALVGAAEPQVLAVAELSYAGLPRAMPRIVSYSAKWRPGSAYFRFTNPVLPARVPDRVRRGLEQTAVRIWHLFGLRGYARIDFRMGRGRPQVIDVNPNPDISADAGLARAARHAGLTYADLIARVTDLARA